jgi:putative two-component system response regulator
MMSDKIKDAPQDGKVEIGRVGTFVIGARKTILVVDDTPFVLNSIKDILGREYDLRFAKNATAAFGILHREMVSLVLLDIEMPGMSGMDFFEYAKELPYFRNTQVIFITANADEHTVTRALNLGAKGYIVKPIVPDKLRAKVHEVLG